MTQAQLSRSTTRLADRPGQRIKDGIPTIYWNILPDWIESEIPVETHATCHDCSMLAENNDDAATQHMSFSPRSKCCTYHPVMYNYMVGGLLSDTSPGIEEGRRRILEKIKNRVGVTPYGILPPAKQLYLYEVIGDSFGRAESLVCPYYENGDCTVYDYRESTCYTWFCKYVSGHDGMHFWQSMKSYIHHAERTLADYVIHQLGLNPLGMFQRGKGLTLEGLEDRPLPELQYRALWGAWHSRETDFYIETFRLANDLKRVDFERLEGIAGVVHLDDVKKKRTQMMTPELPRFLKRNPKLEVEKIADDQYLVVVQPTRLQSISLRRRVYDILDYFDGRQAHEETIQRIKDQTNVTVSQDLLAGLYQFRILVGA